MLLGTGSCEFLSPFAWQACADLGVDPSGGKRKRLLSERVWAGLAGEDASEEEASQRACAASARLFDRIAEAELAAREAEGSPRSSPYPGESPAKGPMDPRGSVSSGQRAPPSYVHACRQCCQLRLRAPLGACAARHAVCGARPAGFGACVVWQCERVCLLRQVRAGLASIARDHKRKAVLKQELQEARAAMEAMQRQLWALQEVMEAEQGVRYASEDSSGDESDAHDRRAGRRSSRGSL